MLFLGCARSLVSTTKIPPTASDYLKISPCTHSSCSIWDVLSSYKVKSVPIWLQIRLISAGLKPDLMHNKKSNSLVLYCREFFPALLVVAFGANKTGINPIIFLFTISWSIHNVFDRGACACPYDYTQVSPPTPWLLRSKHQETMATLDKHIDSL